ncbi:MAG: hypothetical protein SPI86_01605 [Treponemataceae bacterium]|nr:hypothetical protein [Treponemataceae bacterium]
MTAVFIFLVVIKFNNDDVDVSFSCIFCITALLGLSLGLLAIMFCGKDIGKSKILSKDFNNLSDKIIPCPKKKSNEKNPKGTSGGENNDDKLGETARVSAFKIRVILKSCG